jgi:hypothetical protein
LNGTENALAGIFKREELYVYDMEDNQVVFADYLEASNWFNLAYDEEHPELIFFSLCGVVKKENVEKAHAILARLGVIQD